VVPIRYPDVESGRPSYPVSSRFSRRGLNRGLIGLDPLAAILPNLVSESSASPFRDRLLVGFILQVRLYHFDALLRVTR
jgi:hypothetical protein